MEIVIKYQRSFRDIQSVGSSGVFMKVPGFTEESWIIIDQGNKFEFLKVCNSLTLINWTVSCQMSEEFVAFIKYLDVFYDLETNWSSDFERIIQGK